jgi:tetratricopeptide (TPR) repeat protein
MGHGHAHEAHGHHHHGHEHSPQVELERGLELVDAGDFEHAASHLATAAGGDPANPRLKGAVRTICAREKDPLELVSLRNGGHVGAFVLRAMLEAEVGKLTDSLCHLLQAEAHDPSLPYLEAVDLRSAPAEVLGSVDAERVGNHLSPLGSRIDRLDEPEKTAALLRARSLFDKLLPHHDRSEALTFAACVLLRRMKAYDDAIGLAERFLAKSRNRRILIALGSSSREKGERDRAIAAYEEAQAMDPNEIGPSLDLGDMHGEAGRFQEALAAYTFALRGEPDNEWARASLHYYRFLLTDDTAALAELATLAQDDDNRRAQRLHRLATVYEHSLPPIRDAILQALDGDDTPLVSASSSLEAPSAIAVARKLAPEMRISHAGPGGKVDPRLPRRAVKTLLWKYRTEDSLKKTTTNDADAVATEADPKVSEAIDEIAARDYSAAGWFDGAKSVAAGLGAKGVGACAAAMVSSEPSEEYWLGDWVFQRQVASAFVMAHLPGGREALWDIVYGPVDWACTAAIVALAQLAIENPVDRLAITTELFAQIESVDCPVGHACLTLPAAHNLLRIPGILPEVRMIAREIRDRDLVR